ncbi:hypothetical protein BofuT4_uP054120.1 [Botrytis cinerea T4]|uniref:Uncharacterized protein n=1 Tax=Botryotinia fuckeliana (strain T4) TaxID=999810 RepID=G2XVJ1_BOTF4|nr:hypothetical protein BofuT4_uP054120.1 [Botrytis cinerea T4]
MAITMEYKSRSCRRIADTVWYMDMDMDMDEFPRHPRGMYGARIDEGRGVRPPCCVTGKGG